MCPLAPMPGVRRARAAATVVVALILGAQTTLASSSSSATVAVLVHRSAGVPSCSTAVAHERWLSGVRTATAPTGAAAGGRRQAPDGSPFAIVTTADGRWSFVSLPSAVAVFSDRAFRPRLVRTVSAPTGGAGEAITHDGRYLLVAGRTGAEVLSVAALERGRRPAVLGSLRGPISFDGAIEVAVSPDDRFAFVSLEDSDAVAVFDLRAALAHGFAKSDLVGTIPVGFLPVGLALSPDGRYLYSTSEESSLGVGTYASPGEGELSVISLARAETQPARAVLTAVTAGCGTVRVVTSHDGSIVWVTARESDELLAFSAHRLLSDPSHALIAHVRVGEAPVGLLLADGSRTVVVADSDRFGRRGATSDVNVVCATAALAGRPALLGRIHTGLFPRQMALEPGSDTVLVTDYGSAAVQAIDLADVPGAIASGVATGRDRGARRPPPRLSRSPSLRRH